MIRTIIYFVLSVQLFCIESLSYVGSRNTILILNTELKASNLSNVIPLQQRLKKFIPQNWNVIVKHFSQINDSIISRGDIDFILLSGQGTPWNQYTSKSISQFKTFLDRCKVPVMGICGGHQLIALCYGSKVAPIKGKLKGISYQGMYRQRGFLEINVKIHDELFAGIKDKATVNQNHVEEVKDLPTGFVLLATNAESPIQVIKHKLKPIYGVQFHPDKYDSTHVDGLTILKNFFKLK